MSLSIVALAVNFSTSAAGFDFINVHFADSFQVVPDSIGEIGRIPHNVAQLLGDSVAMCRCVIALVVANYFLDFIGQFAGLSAEGKGEVINLSVLRTDCGR